MGPGTRSSWPTLIYERDGSTQATLHRFLQLVGKLRLHTTPLQNHYWNVAFHLTARGLTSRPMPWPPRTAERSFTVDFDFVEHRVVVSTSDGMRRQIELGPMTVATFCKRLVDLLADLGIEVTFGSGGEGAPGVIDDRPVEILTERVPLSLDTLHGTYDRAWASAWWEATRRTALVLEEHRARFAGKASPVHFFWGSFDLAASRFSGRPAPPRPAADPITRESYTHEVVSVGFWPGDVRFPQAAWYAYAVPTPDGLADARVLPWQAFWHRDLNEFVLPYDAVQSTADPARALADFAQSTYEAAATRLGWDRAALERDFNGEPRGQPTEPLDAPSPLIH